MSIVKGLKLKGPFRPIFLGLGAFVIFRYLFRRLTSNIPSIDSPFGFTAGFFLVAAECYCVAMLVLSLFSVIDPIDRPSQGCLESLFGDP